MSEVANKNQLFYVDELAAIEEEEPREVLAGTMTLVVGKWNGEVYAVDGICTHAYAELAEGDMDEHCLYCPLHLAAFDIRDGSVIDGPTDQPLSTYEVVVEDGQVWINLG
ncbi:3-phenylpropionate/trans-cinnamate dioxygenase ferredoxin subunit/anthranilate 1,2-dioxygenase large subunit [Halobacillus karajensis]|uniref:Rieske (2Fe-2S) protein n=1 Tax=Halobacillus karajensis TaxID=195088 RepID=UPI0008A73DE7|nr:Rieske 2Fe-2S domain-containing protein [Halobacillus karajensis]SEI04025.1 3-phenylpropionate/trans-cinnamate dioxygenase ferredoxin subunit/anthranilate 1,2-dioxygenase large subunit [Halobacillus karajensis]